MSNDLHAGQSVPPLTQTPTHTHKVRARGEHTIVEAGLGVEESPFHRAYDDFAVSVCVCAARLIPFGVLPSAVGNDDANLWQQLRRTHSSELPCAEQSRYRVHCRFVRERHNKKE